MENSYTGIGGVPVFFSFVLICVGWMKNEFKLT